MLRLPPFQIKPPRSIASLLKAKRIIRANALLEDFRSKMRVVQIFDVVGESVQVVATTNIPTG